MRCKYCGVTRDVLHIPFGSCLVAKGLLIVECQFLLNRERFLWPDSRFGDFTSMTSRLRAKGYPNTSRGEQHKEEPMSETQANQEQVRFWNEQGGPRWVKLQHQLDAQIDQLGLFAMQRAAVQPGEHVIDVGCGCGQASLELAERVGPEGTVLGVDISAPMLARARDRQSELNHKNLAFVEADAQTSRFEPDRFDLVFSRFGVMFFENPAAAFANLHTAVSPGGRVCFVCWQALDKNEWARVPFAAATRHVPIMTPALPDAPGPFAFANPERVANVLKTAGFTRVKLEPHKAQLTMGAATTVDEAVDFTLEIGPISRLLAEVSADIRSRVREDLRTVLAPYAKHNEVRLGGAAWIVTARKQ